MPGARVPEGDVAVPGRVLEVPFSWATVGGGVVLPERDEREAGPREPA
ncbi:hypothetical protein LAM22_20265 [Mycobacterium tuberculosis]|nr:hypothetical protein [Mycobacterium tuberculosis]